jgi:hypothetical protein
MVPDSSLRTIETLFNFVNFCSQALKKIQGAYMVRLVAFVMAAAIVAGAATFVLVATPEVEASAPKAAVKGDRLDIRPVRVAPVRGACMQRAWPVYESECRVNHVV